MSKLAVFALAAAAAALLSACATRPVNVAADVKGDARMQIDSGGVIRVTVRSPDAFGMAKDGVVTFKPGDPAYDLMRMQAESGAAAKHKPILIWEIGTPEFVDPPPAKPKTASAAPAPVTQAAAASAAPTP